MILHLLDYFRFPEALLPALYDHMQISFSCDQFQNRPSLHLVPDIDETLEVRACPLMPSPFHFLQMLVTETLTYVEKSSIFICVAFFLILSPFIPKDFWVSDTRDSIKRTKRFQRVGWVYHKWANLYEQNPSGDSFGCVSS